ncbi:hypothetical protein Tco_1329277 [Tanacetum coccineum]|uniref:Retrotransposon gag domain-containing protein n=1 Tax=Tanacetum coccineum TaxID=301880 RepID=A0ABQ4XFJ4_9ASTR
MWKCSCKDQVRTIQQRKEDLFDEYERFRAIGNESIHDYFVRFHKLVNDMTKLLCQYPTHQMNNKMSTTFWLIGERIRMNLIAKKTLKKQDSLQVLVDATGLVLLTPHLHLFFITLIFSPQPTAQSSNDALMATMTQIANLLSGFQKQFPPTNNQLRTSSNSKTHATVHDGQIVTEPIQRKAPE